MAKWIYRKVTPKNTNHLGTSFKILDEAGGQVGIVFDEIVAKSIVLFGNMNLQVKKVKQEMQDFLEVADDKEKAIVQDWINMLGGE